MYWSIIIIHYPYMYSVFIWVLSGNGINPWQIENRKHDDTSLDLVLYVEKTHMFMHPSFPNGLDCDFGSRSFPSLMACRPCVCASWGNGLSGKSPDVNVKYVKSGLFWNSQIFWGLVPGSWWFMCIFTILAIQLAWLWWGFRDAQAHHEQIDGVSPELNSSRATHSQLDSYDSYDSYEEPVATLLVLTRYWRLNLKPLKKIKAWLDLTGFKRSYSITFTHKVGWNRLDVLALLIYAI